MSEVEEMKLVRDCLEAELGAAVAAKLLFAALDEPDADMDAGALAFVHGPMQRMLTTRFGGDRAADIHSRMVEALDPVGGITIDESAFEDSTLTTRSLLEESGPLKVLVLARNSRLVRKLEMALGADKIGAAAARDEAALGRLEGVLVPDVVVVDGQSAADVPPAALAEVLEKHPTRLILVWCADQPAGSAVSNALEGRGIEFVPIPRSAGVDPLIDYLRSRMG